MVRNDLHRPKITYKLQMVCFMSWKPLRRHWTPDGEDNVSTCMGCIHSIFFWLIMWLESPRFNDSSLVHWPMLSLHAIHIITAKLWVYNEHHSLMWLGYVGFWGNHPKINLFQVGASLEGRDMNVPYPLDPAISPPGVAHGQKLEIVWWFNSAKMDHL